MYPTNNMQYPNGQLGVNYAAGLGGFQAFQPQQMTQSTQRPVIFGRVVTSPQDITANDVPMDGTSGIYPLRDESAIYVKRWSSDGTISTVKFVPETPEKVEDKPSEIEELKSWLDQRLNQIVRPSFDERRYKNDRYSTNGTKFNKKQSTGSRQSKSERIDTDN